ncbi:Dabb family protein [Singulisphaera sp. PoT]|uniref:Dabb family protein n=1 Tax=Singulisphaera sp. PoT TaxID=3411797 RepID=UPI003BF611A5
MLAHNVYFTLKDASEASIEKMVTACKTYLADHPGVVFFACGTLEPELNRPVNVVDYHVALHVVFDSRASHDLYQEAPLHKKFIEENRDNWGTVRVFDSIVASA